MDRRQLSFGILTTVFFSHPAITLGKGYGMKIYYGDSITGQDGAQATMGASGVYYPWIVAAHTGEPDFLNLASNGAKSQDQIDSVYAHTPASGDEFFYLIGTNDRVTYGASSNAQTLFRNAVSAAVYWLAGGKTLASSCTLNGSWANCQHFGEQFSRASGVANDYVEASFTGDAFLFGYSLVDGFNGTFSVSVDGVSKGTFSCLSPATIGGRGYGPGVLRITGCGAGSHTARVTVLSNGLGFEYIGNGTPNSNPVYLLTQPRTSSSGDDANVAIYNGILSSIATQATADGYSVTLIDVGSKIDRTIDLVDPAHPNNRGHLKMAAEILRVIE